MGRRLEPGVGEQGWEGDRSPGSGFKEEKRLPRLPGEGLEKYFS